MPSEIIFNCLLLDTVDRNPALLTYANGGIFPSVDKVPEYLYKSLLTLVAGSSGQSTNAALAKALVADRGTGDEYSGGMIAIYADRTIPSTYDYQGMRNDTFGAESAYIRIVITKPNRVTDPKLIFNISQRIAYVLDYSARQLRNLPSNIEAAGDISIADPLTSVHPSYFFCRYDGINDPWSAQRLTIAFRCEYVRLFCG